MPQHCCEFLPALLNVTWGESGMNLPSNLWSISSFEGSFVDGDCMLDPFSVMDLLETLQRYIQLLLFCRTANCCAGHVAVVMAGVKLCCNERPETLGKMEKVISKRVPAETTRLEHESWISMLVLPHLCGRPTQPGFSPAILCEANKPAWSFWWRCLSKTWCNPGNSINLLKMAECSYNQ